MIENGWSSVGTVASPINGRHHNPIRMTIHNNDNTQAVFLGGTAVTATNGLTIEKLETLQFDLEPLEQLYAVSLKTGHIISWLRQTI
jgi:hypothetical protein